MAKRESVECRGLRYALPYETVSKPTYVKDKFVGQALDSVLGRMYLIGHLRRRRGGGQRRRQTSGSDAEAEEEEEEETDNDAECREFWRGEILAGRVELRPRKRSIDDPLWVWSTPTSVPIVTGGCQIRVRRHVHERIVPAIDVRKRILFEDKDLIALNKPPGIATVDETGGTGVNSLMTIVGEALDSEAAGGNRSSKCSPTPAHRLDKPVSGVLLLGKSKQQAARMLKKISRKDGGVEKVYVARVRRVGSRDVRSGGAEADKDALMAEHAMRMFPSDSATAAVFVGDIQGCPSLHKIPVLDRSSFSHSAFESSAATTAGVVSVPREFPPRVSILAELGWDSQNKRAVVLDCTDAKAKAEARSRCRGGEDKKARRRAAAQSDAETRATAAMTADGSRGDGCTGVAAPNSTVDATDGTTQDDATSSAASSTQTFSPAARTDFRLLTPRPLPDGTFLVVCRPRGGQRHQIRAHLALMGWPIANDEVYGGDGGIPFGATSADPEAECGGESEIGSAYADDEHGTLRNVLVNERCLREWCPKCKWIARMLLVPEKGPPPQTSPGLWWVLEDGSNGGSGAAKVNCNKGQQQQEQNQQDKPSIEVTMEIWLHSARYVVPAAGLDVKAPLPAWAAVAQDAAV